MATRPGERDGGPDQAQYAQSERCGTALGAVSGAVIEPSKERGKLRHGNREIDDADGDQHDAKDEEHDGERASR